MHVRRAVECVPPRGRWAHQGASVDAKVAIPGSPSQAARLADVGTATREMGTTHPGLETERSRARPGLAALSDLRNFPFYDATGAAKRMMLREPSR